MTKKRTAEKIPQIWAIGGGKGGTGKTFIISRLAIFLASYGKRVILIDANFDSPNIHYFINFQNTEKSILDFFQDNENLENLIQETKIKNLRVIPGNQNGISFPGIKYKQKMRFFNDLKKMDVNYILMDLGSGSGISTLDFFLEADRKIVVTDLEILSIDNLFHFIRNTYFRRLSGLLPTQQLKNTVWDLWNKRTQYQIKTSGDVVRHLGKISEQMNDSSEKKLSLLQIHLIVNKVRKANDIMEGFSVRSICTKYLSVETFYSGYLEYDNQLWKNFSLVPSKKFTISPRIEQEIISIAENIKKSSQMKIDRIKNV
ncbi:MAG: AAA family ATPase [Candidatus Aminicenantes bacterium]|nr:AAA family ATPase [Candidatus Aminicenantes bacterium]